MSHTAQPPQPQKPNPPSPFDNPTGELLGMVQEHSESFVNDLIDFGREQIVMVTTEVTFGNGTTLKFCRDDFGDVIFGDDFDEDDEDD